MDCKPLVIVMSKIALIVIAFLFVSSALIANFLDSLNTAKDLNSTHDSHRFRQKKLLEQRSRDPVVIGDKLEHTFWFMQISDIHISIHFDPKRAPDLQQFCSQYIDIMRPSVVLATGDLTDARTRDPMGSTVFEEEWILYWQALNSTNITARTHWLDIKGNHDNFNVFNWNSDNNFFRKYSVRGPHNTRSYKFRVSHESETYSFIGVDACLDPSPKRPFNFIGLLHQKDIDQLTSLRDAESDSNYTIWFGHYPTSSIAMPRPGLRDLINGPYLCGHYHTIGGLVPHMYSSQPQGFLELELSDWKDLRTLRLLAVDHGLFTFVDFRFNQWPVILVTNPKNALYSMPALEPSHRVANSTHIRALVFSNHTITGVEVKIDDDQWLEMRHVSGPLYVRQWNPSLYGSGLHSIQVTAEDSDHNKQTVRHQFSIDGSKPEFPFGARFMLRIDNRLIGYFLFGFAVSLCVLPLVLMRIIRITRKGKSIEELAETNRSRRFVYKLYLLSNTDRLFYPLISIPLYATVGPWFVGYVLDDHIGVCFVWGMIIGQSYIPGGFTYILGSLMLLLFQVPITCCLANIAYCRRQELRTGKPGGNGFLRVYCHVRHLLILFFIICHILYSTGFYFAYGLMAYALGFFMTWSYVIFMILWQMAVRLSPNCFCDCVRPDYKKRRDSDDNGEQLLVLKRPPIRK